MDLNERSKHESSFRGRNMKSGVYTTKYKLGDHQFFGCKSSAGQGLKYSKQKGQTISIRQSEEVKSREHSVGTETQVRGMALWPQESKKMHLIAREAALVGSKSHIHV